MRLGDRVVIVADDPSGSTYNHWRYRRGDRGRIEAEVEGEFFSRRVILDGRSDEVRVPLDAMRVLNVIERIGEIETL